MSFSSGTRTLFVEVASWCVVAGVAAWSLTHYDQVKLLTARVLGLPGQGQIESETAARREGESQVPQRSGAVVEIPAGQGGHYYTEAEINGRPVDVLVDTGATMVFLSYEMAESVGIYLKPGDFTHTSRTANGTARIAPVMLDRVSIGEITVRRVQAAVAEPGKLTTPALLGMSFLGRVSNVGMRNGVLVLQD